MSVTIKIAGKEITPSMIVGGLDYGFADPFVIEIGAKIGSCWINLREVYEPRLGINEVLRLVVQTTRKYGVQRYWADSEDPQMTNYLQTHGVVVVSNQIKDLDFGIRTLYALMKQEVDHPLLGKGPKFRVDRQACPNLIREIGLYGYQAVRGEVRTAAPTDRHNHALDAVRYYITGEGEIPPDVYIDQDVRRRPMYTKDGVWYDDPVETQRRHAYRHADEPGLWWDEKGILESEVDSIVELEDW